MSLKLQSRKKQGERWSDHVSVQVLFWCSTYVHNKGKLLEKVAWNQETEPSWGNTVVLAGTELSVQASLDYLFAFFPSLNLRGLFFFDVCLSTEEHLWWLLPFTVQCQQVGGWVMPRQTSLTVSSGSGWKKMEFPWMSGKRFIKNVSCRKLSVNESFEELSFLPSQNNILWIISL